MSIVLRGTVIIKDTPSSGGSNPLLARDPSSGDLGVSPAGLPSTLTNGYIFVGNGSNVAVGVIPSGDITLSNTGVFGIATGVIVNTDINASAAIALTKLAATTASKALVSDGSGFITTSATSATEIGYVTGVTSAIQTQLNAKQATITGGATTIATSDLTPNFALISSSLGKVAVSSISATKLGYLSGVTSSIQTQLNTQILGHTTSAILQAPTGTQAGYAITWDNANTEFNLTPISAAGVPNGGTTNQYLIKASNADQDTAWATLVLANVTDVFLSTSEINALSGLDFTNVNATQLNFLSGLTSNVQTQVDGKLTNSLAYNAIFIGNASNLASQLAPGSNGQILTMIGAAPAWQTPTPPGNVSGVAPSVDNAIARWNGTLADSIQNSLVIISDTGDVSGIVNLTATDISTATTIGSAYIYRVGGTDVAVADGGTNISSYTIGDTLYASGATTLSKLAAGTAAYVLTSNGPGVAPSWQVGGGGGGAVSSVSGTTNRISVSPTTGATVVDIDAAYVGQSSITTLGTITTGTWNATAIGVAKGGTNLTSYTVGDIIYASGTTTLSKLSDVATGNALISGGAATAPFWGKIGLSTHISGVLPIANGGTNLSALGTAKQILRTNAGATALEYVTFSNGSGTTFNGDGVDLGGTLTANTTIIGGGFTFNIGTSSNPTRFNMYSDANAAISCEANLSLNTLGVGAITTISSNDQISEEVVLVIGSGVSSSTFTDNRTVKKGLQYAAAGYVTTARSLTDKGYVDGLVGGAGTVTTVSVVSANGFNGSVANATTTPAITISTTITGIIKGNGTAISAATSGTDYSAGTSALATGILKSTTTTGALTIAVAGDFPTLNQNTTGTAANLSGTPVLPNGTTATTQSPGTTGATLATVDFVANAVLGQRAKEAAKYASTAALPSIVYANGSSGVGATLTGVALAAISLDGSSPSVNDRVLIKNQASTLQNGIYTVTQTGSGIAVFILTRATDFDQATDIQTGDIVFITSGNTLSTTTWTYTGGDAPVLGTDPITYVQTAGQGSFTAGNGITITGTSIAIDTSVTVDKTTAQTLTNKTLTSPVLTTPDLGTPSALVGTNITGTAAGLTAGTVTTNANLTGDITSSGNATSYNNIVPLTKGGTNANLTASNGGIFYSTASAGAILSGTGTANKMLLSGASTTPTWSTSTIPSSAGSTANKLLLSDGTNYVLSTPTFPNASATSGKIIKSDGTNWVASTETYAVPGTTGNLLVSDGTNWIAQAQSVLGAYLLASGGTATASNTFTFNTANWLNVNGTWTATANNQFNGQFGGSLTARGTTTDNLIGYLFNPTLIAAANSQSLVVLDINATYTNGAFTTLRNLGLRMQNGSALLGAALSNVNRDTYRLEVIGHGASTSSAAIAAYNSSNNLLFATQDDGQVILGAAGGNNSPRIAAQNASVRSISGQGLLFIPHFSNSSTNRMGIHLQGNAITENATTTTSLVYTDQGFSPAAGANALRLFNAVPVINQTSTASGSVSGYVYDPTLTAILGSNYSFTSSSGSAGFGTLTPTSTVQVSGSFAAAYVAKTANYTLTASDRLVNCTANSFTITLPTAVGITGREYIVKNTGAGTITLATASSQTIDGSAPGSLGAGPTVSRLMSDGANWITW